MSQNHADIPSNLDAWWDEYLSTGIDPTGGQIGPDFDPETGIFLDDPDEDDAYEEDET